MLYYYGDNINFILERYGEDLGCGDACIENNRIAAVVTLGMSLILFHITPGILKKIAIMNDWEDPETGWSYALDMLVVIVKIDTVFTVVAIMAQTGEFCSSVDVGLSWSFVVICFFAGLVAMIVYGVFSCSDKLDNAASSIYINIAFFLLQFCFLVYLLADNQQPLDCAFGCDTFAANMTQNEIDCNMRGSAGLRLGFMGATLLIVIFVSCGLLIGFEQDYHYRHHNVSKPV